MSIDVHPEWRWSRVFVAALVLLLTIACSPEKKEVMVNPPRVNVSGQFAIIAGRTVPLTATTVGGTDAGYAWSSSEPSVAKVSNTGSVTGLVPGRATITATGTSTGLSGQYNVVVANEIPQQTAWLSSGHADAASESFNYWNTARAVPKACARCHSTPGFRDYLGDDGTTPFRVDADAPVGTVVSCEACHNASAQTLSQVTFPPPENATTITGLGAESRCMTCHQGSESRTTVEAAIVAAGAATDADAVSTALSFKDVHSLPAGATLNGARASVGYQYAGKKYDWRFRHVPEKDTCIECHDPHSLEVDATSCGVCHAGVTSQADLRNIRFKSSVAVDYDGDGNTTEGIAGEIDGLRAALLTAIQHYAHEKGSAICYSATTDPYFLLDSDGDGDCTDETGEFDTWTARLVRATFNYQLAVKDPGAFAHNAKYVIQLLFDAIEDLNAGLPAEHRVDMTAMRRDDLGHFFGAGKPARYGWDTNGYVNGGTPSTNYQPCSKCHSGSEGFRFFLTYGITNPIGVKEPGNGLDCMTCHTSFPASIATPNLVSVASVTFPSGKVVSPNASAPWGSRLGGSSFICMTCHSARESGSTQKAAIPSTLDGDAVSTAVTFKVVHYLPAGAILLGKEAAVGYEYDTMPYASRATHPFGIECNGCHSAVATNHTFRVQDNLGACAVCHGVPETGGLRAPTIDELRGAAVLGQRNDFDYDGDNDVTEPLRNEVAGLADKLFVAMGTYAAGKGGAICYSDAHPHFRVVGGDGSCTTVAYTKWTPKLVRAAFNYLLARKEPGAWAHNITYISQLLYDSINDLGGDLTGVTRAN